MNPIFKRIEEIIEFSKAGTINEFAIKKLGYTSAEKLARLKRENKDPSTEIIQDILKAVPEINGHWLLTGKGSMLEDEEIKPIIEDPYKEKYYKSLEDQIDLLKGDIKTSLEGIQQAMHVNLKLLESLDRQMKDRTGKGKNANGKEQKGRKAGS